MPASKAISPSIKFKRADFEALAAARGVRNDAERARFLGVDPSNYHRISRGKTKPSEHFVAAVLTAFAEDGGVTFETVFEVSR